MEADAAQGLRLRVRRISRPAEGIWGYELVSGDGTALPEFTAGAHVSVRTPGGYERKYSLCNGPGERDRYEIAVLRDSGGRGGSVDLTDQVCEGDDLEVSLPRNDFPLVPAAAGYLFIAGGIGITPILSMIRQLRATGAARCRLIYLTRNAAQAAFADELNRPQWQGQVVMHHDEGDPERAFDLWPLLEKPAGRHVYCCGPAGLMNAVRDMTGHWPSSSVHFEAFADAAVVKADDVPFTVRLARSGACVAVPVGQSILEALRAAGHDLPSSCESGSCGTCRTQLIRGTVDHRDFVLREDEHDTHIMICVSRSVGGVELEIDV